MLEQRGRPILVRNQAAQITTKSPRFNAETTLVLIPATVTDPLNRFVLGLQKQDFHLFEDGTEQTIAHFSARMRRYRWAWFLTPAAVWALSCEPHVRLRFDSSLR